jgi:hypothetical protein
LASSDTLVMTVSGVMKAKGLKVQQYCRVSCVLRPVAADRPVSRWATSSVVRVRRPGRVVYSCQMDSGGRRVRVKDRADTRSSTAAVFWGGGGGGQGG